MPYGHDYFYYNNHHPQEYQDKPELHYQITFSQSNIQQKFTWNQDLISYILE